MAFRSFSVGPAKGLRRASWDGLPNLVVICGPNGSGKSTLLHQLWLNRTIQAEPNTEVIFMGPNRPWRKSALTGAAMYTMPQSFRQLLGMAQIPGWQLFAPQGLEYIGGKVREPDSTDEAQGLAKLSITKLGLRRLEALGEVYDREGGQIPLGTLPDIFAPLKTLTRYLLPHLEFDRIDARNEQDIRCLFRRIDGDSNTLIDIDDLSSGEKAVVTLFLPFLESQIQRLIDGTSYHVTGTPVAPPVALPTALIDEPEIHLHPTLQASLIDYLRDMTRAGEAQFIVTTHSPTILDSLHDNELFLVAPISSVGDGNQFVRITSSEERLEAIRTLTGSTHLVTRCRPIVFLEGERPGSPKAVSDQRLVEMLIPESVSWVLVSAAGRAEAVRAASQLRDAASDGLPGVPVFALVDADRADAGDPDYAISWPVAMIENLLLDPEALWQVLAPFTEQTGLNSSQAIDEELRRIAREQAKDEIRLRAKTAIKVVRAEVKIDASDSIDEAIIEARRSIEDQLNALEKDSIKLSEQVRIAKDKVDHILAEGKELEAFRGKIVLKFFYDKRAKSSFPGYRAFVYTLAQQVRSLPRLANLVSMPVSRIQEYIPPDLVTLIQSASVKLPEGPERDVALEALEHAREARTHWETGIESGNQDGKGNSMANAANIDPNKLREQVVAIARSLRNHGFTDVEQPLLAAMVQIGLGAMGSLGGPSSVAAQAAKSIRP